MTKWYIYIHIYGEKETETDRTNPQNKLIYCQKIVDKSEENMVLKSEYTNIGE